MPELVVDFITSLDGYASAEGWPGWWGLEGPEYLAWLGENPEADYVLLMGANTYRLMYGFTKEGEPGTDVLGGVSKVVFSNSLTEPLAWENSTLIAGDPAEAVRRMKQNGDRSMRTIGSLTLCRSLLESGLVDRFRVVMFPVITGATGQERIYDGYPDVALDMTDSRTFDGQIQLVEYVPSVLAGHPALPERGAPIWNRDDARPPFGRPGHIGWWPCQRQCWRSGVVRAARVRVGDDWAGQDDLLRLGRGGLRALSWMGRPLPREPARGYCHDMATSVYVAAVEGFTGKSTVALGVLEQLSRRVERVAVYRPVVRGDAATDYVLDLLVSHDAVQLTYDEGAGVTYAELHRDPEAALDRIVDRFHQVADKADAVVVVGSDYTDVGAPTEFSFNAKIAANLGSPVLLVLNAHDRELVEMRTAADLAVIELTANHGTLFAIVANRANPGDGDVDAVAKALEGHGVPAFVLPEEPLLSAPSMADLMAACDGTLVSGEESLLSQETTGVMVAAMTLPHVLDRLFDGAVVVTPGDRPEVVLGVLTAQVSANFPQMAGIVLNGGFELPEQVSRLIDGLGATMPIVNTSLDTSDTTKALTSVRGRLHKDSPRKVATALALFEERVDRDLLLDRLEVARTRAVTPLMFEHQLIDKAVSDRRQIVLPEGDDDRILQAADILLRRKVADLIILGEPREIQQRAALLGVDVSAARLLSPADPKLRGRFAAAYHERRKHKGIDLERARDIVIDVSYFGTMMVELGLADGMVSGAAHTTAHTIRPALEVVRTAPDVSVVSSVFFMCMRDQVLVYGDCAVNPDPTAAQLADIAMASARTAGAFGVEPRVAMLSYSTGASGAGSDVDKVIEATAMVRERAPAMLVEGPIQYDAAIDAAVARTKLPDSQVAGRATVFIFPDLNTGNNTYKAVQRSAGALAVGPILQGLRKPVNDLSRGALVRDIVNTVAITAIQAQSLGRL